MQKNDYIFWAVHNFLESLICVCLCVYSKGIRCSAHQSESKPDAVASTCTVGGCPDPVISDVSRAPLSTNPRPRLLGRWLRLRRNARPNNVQRRARRVHVASDPRPSVWQSGRLWGCSAWRRNGTQYPETAAGCRKVLPGCVHEFFPAPSDRPLRAFGADIPPEPASDSVAGFLLEGGRGCTAGPDWLTDCNVAGSRRASVHSLLGKHAPRFALPRRSSDVHCLAESVLSQHRIC